MSRPNNFVSLPPTLKWLSERGCVKGGLEGLKQGVGARRVIKMFSKQVNLIGLEGFGGLEGDYNNPKKIKKKREGIIIINMVLRGPPREAKQKGF